MAISPQKSIKMKEEIKGWFDCLNAIAIEMEIDECDNAYDKMLIVMINAGITLEEVRWAQEQKYTMLDKSNLLNCYEGILMQDEED